jgi:hypothetical protein
MAQILGQNQELQINLTDPTGLAGTWKNLVCMRNFTVNTELPTTSEETNCGTKTAVGNVTVTVDFDAICETAPTVASQISYEEMLTAINSKTLVSVKVSSPGAGDAYYHQFSAFITSLSLSQEAGAYISFTGTLTSDGTMDINA